MIMEPKLPQPGVVTQFSLDGVGRIRLDDGTELKVGAVALKDVVSFEGGERAVVGIGVLVREVSPHPLGGLRATRLERTTKAIAFGHPTTPKAWSNRLRGV